VSLVGVGRVMGS